MFQKWLADNVQAATDVDNVKNNDMATQAQLTRLKELIAIELDYCSKDDWPYVCNMTSTPEGKKRVEDMVIQQCSSNGCSVGSALDRIERMFNPNRMED